MEFTGKTRKKGIIFVITLLIVICIVAGYFLAVLSRKEEEAIQPAPQSVDVDTATADNYDEWRYYYEMNAEEEVPSVYERAEWDRPQEQVEVNEAEALNKGVQTSQDAYDAYTSQMGNTDAEAEENKSMGVEHTILEMTFTPCDYYVKTKNNVNTRMEPSTSAEKGETGLKAGQVVHVITESESWLQIELDGVTYYIYKNTVTVTEAPEEEINE